MIRTAWLLLKAGLFVTVILFLGQKIEIQNQTLSEYVHNWVLKIYQQTSKKISVNIKNDKIELALSKEKQRQKTQASLSLQEKNNLRALLHRLNSSTRPSHQQ